MNILYIADPTSVHDVRWINFFACNKGVRCFIIARKWHRRQYCRAGSGLDGRVTLVDFIDDPSTVRLWRTWIQVRRIADIIKKHNIHIFHVLYAEPNALWARWKHTFRIPVMITTRGTDILKTIPAFFETRRPLNKRIAATYRNAFNNADFITCTSTHQIETLRRLGISTSHAHVIRTGVDFDLVKQRKCNSAVIYGIKKPFVLMPRNMSPLYNHGLTLEAIALLDTELRNKYTFVFVNNDTKDRVYFDAIHKKAKETNATIQFLPSLTHGHLMSLFMEATLVVMNPLSDGSPVTAMEAMACKAPLILPPLPYDPVLFKDVFTFSQWTPDSLKNTLSEVLQMPTEELSRITHQNFLSVREYGNTAIELNKIYDLYERLMTGMARCPRHSYCP